MKNISFILFILSFICMLKDFSYQIDEHAGKIKIRKNRLGFLPPLLTFSLLFGKNTAFLGKKKIIPTSRPFPVFQIN